MSKNYKVQLWQPYITARKTNCKILLYIFVCAVKVVCCLECVYYMEKIKCVFDKKMFLLADGVDVYMDRS